MKRRILEVREAGQGALGPFLQQALGLSEAEVRRLLERGAVYRAGRRCSGYDAPLERGDRVTAILEEAGRSTTAEQARAAPVPAVLFQDEWVLGVDKPPGLPAQPTPGGTEASLLDWAGAHLGHEAGLVHRLDRETSGVTVFGVRKEATAALARQFRGGQARKRYLAIAGPGLIGRGTIELPISRDPSRPGRYRASAQANGVPASTDWRVLGGTADFTVVELLPRTGRTHQLRAHLAALGHSIAGDLRYGGASAPGGLPAPRCLLHAQSLVLQHPGTGRALTLVAPMPGDMAPFFAVAGVSA